MKRLIALVSILFLGTTVYAQNIKLIKTANLFDENRGVVEESGDEVDAEKEVKLPANMPVLDGIMVAGKYKRAIFTYYDKEKRKKISRPHKEGDKFGGAFLKKITPEYVLLVFDSTGYKLTPDVKLKKGSSRTMRSYTKSSNVKRYSSDSKKVVDIRENSKRSSVSGRIRRPVNVERARKEFLNRVKRKYRIPQRKRSVRKHVPVRNRPHVRRNKNFSNRSNPFTGGRAPVRPAPHKRNNRSVRTPF